VVLAAAGKPAKLKGQYFSREGGRPAKAARFFCANDLDMLVPQDRGDKMRYPLPAPSFGDDVKTALRRFESGLYEQAGTQALALLQKNPADHDALYLLRMVERRLARDKTLPPATLIWQFNPRGSWERDWLHLLLKGAFAEEVVDNTWTRQAPVMIVVDNWLVAEKLPYYQRAFEAGCRIILIHLSDEAFKDDYGVYRYCDGVVRNYYSERLADLRRVHFIPLGYKAGFIKTSDAKKPASQRKHMWGFAGDAKKYTRAEMIQAMQGLGDGFTHLTEGFDSADALSVEAYRTMLEACVLAPCPSGWSNLETFRVYEALEAGCIPIVERRPGFDYFTRLLGPHPMPSVSAWSEVMPLVTQLRNNGGLDQLQRTCGDWWQERKSALGRDTRQFITDALTDI